MGFPGSIHGSRMLKSSQLYRKCEESEILSKPEKIIGGFRVRPVLLGDGAYPPTSWLVKPYQNNIHLNDQQKNRSLSRARVAIERAFGFLKGRWCYLLKRLDHEIESIADTTLTCFVLHNLTQIKGEIFIDYNNIVDEVIREERAAMQRMEICNQLCVRGKRLRDVLAAYILDEE